MNSPPDPGSPISTDTESPPPEEIISQPSDNPHFLNIASHITQSLVSGGAKRRLPGGSSFGASSSNRDPKSRRRGDLARTGGAGGGLWESTKETKREERDLVDHHVVDFLRKGASLLYWIEDVDLNVEATEIGDPFLETLVQRHA
ncbi:hypothetical protein FPV67DRAFT_1462147 [Lyophyllum atratum]|nr:hypothetical protein FPV67DRAFT_1462147 [Lyophyllum atratum]